MVGPMLAVYMETRFCVGGGGGRGQLETQILSQNIIDCLRKDPMHCFSVDLQFKTYHIYAKIRKASFYFPLTQKCRIDPRVPCANDESSIQSQEFVKTDWVDSEHLQEITGI